MKIVDWKTFVDMPENTLFSKWEPCVFGELCIKGESLGNPPIDFYVQYISDPVDFDNSSDYVDMCHAAAQNGDSLPIDLDCVQRDALFDQDQLFAVWEQDDVKLLIERLQRCVKE